MKLKRFFNFFVQGKRIEAGFTDPEKSSPCCRALYDYEAKNPDELSFPKGSIIRIIEERADGWWIGEYKEGKFGRIPATYLKKLSDEQSQEFTLRQQHNE